MKKLDKKSTNDRIIIDLESMNYQCMKVIGMYNYLEIKKELKMHRHEGMLEICFLEKGSQYYHIQGKDYFIKGGDLLITFPGEEHGTRSYPEDKGRLFWLIITIPKNKQTLLNLNIQESKTIIDELLSLKSNRKFEGASHLKSDLNRVFQVYNEMDSILRRVKITNLLLGFLVKVIECGRSKIDVSMSREIQEITSYINENLHNDLFLDELAHQANLSLSHFKYRFKKEVGHSPADYIIGKKIESAKKQLSEGNSIADVAYSLSFSSPSYFATVFKRYTGKTPTLFRTTDKGAGSYGLFSAGKVLC